MLQQHLQEKEGLFLKFDLNALSSQLPGTLVDLKEPETNKARPGSTGSVRHASTPLRTEFTTTVKRQEQDRSAFLTLTTKRAKVPAQTGLKTRSCVENPMTQKTRYTLTLFLTVITIFGSTMATLAHAGVCSQATVAGRWAFTATGSVILPTGAAVPVLQVGTFRERTGRETSRARRHEASAEA